MAEQCGICALLHAVETKEDFEKIARVAIEIRQELMAKIPRTRDAHDPTRFIRFLEETIKLMKEVKAISELRYDRAEWENAMATHKHGFDVTEDLCGIGLLFGRS